MHLITETDAVEVGDLEARLQTFYDSCPNYDAFAVPSNHPTVWAVVLGLARETLQRQGACRILEVGAGRSGFGARLRAESLQGVTLSSHDITARNRDFLAIDAAVLIGPVAELTGTYDIIFHTYAFEHMIRPRRDLLHLWQLLAGGGSLVIQCPRYDRPFYLPPSCDHLTRGAWLALALRLIGRDALGLFSGKPQFLLFSDPSALHRPFYRDRDAVHRVKRADLARLLGLQAEITDFPLPAHGWKDYLVKRWFTLRVVIRKRLSP